jgi:SSS family solute:Na+ symporter
MAAVMASDSQILALSTMFTEDFFAFYGGKRRFGERVQVQTGRIFVVVLTIIAYAIAMRVPESIFALATQYAFSGYSALAPLLVAALFWKRSTRWGALASTLWVASAVIAVAVFQSLVPPSPTPFWTVSGVDVLSRGPAGATVFGFLPVVPMTIISALLMLVVSLMTRGPSRATVARYFPDEGASAVESVSAVNALSER